MSKFSEFFCKAWHCLPFTIQSGEIRGNNHRLRIYRRMERKYKKYVNPNITCGSESSNYVFVCWLQGEENAPDIVKACIKSMRDNLHGWKVVVITRDNMKDWVDIPEYVLKKWNKKLMSNTHFSDILRVALLAKHGGLWLDSTVLCTGDISRYVNKDTNLFVYKNEYRGDKASCLSSWLIYAKKNEPIIVNTRDLLYRYWKHHLWLNEYFLFHILFTICAGVFKEEFDGVRFETNIYPHLLQFKYLFAPYDEKIMKKLCEYSNFHKLSYKVDRKKLDKNSFYETICTWK